MRKGQAAMEFLMTYGWAILVVLAAIGALAYFGVLSPDRFLPNKCVANPPFSCNQFLVDSTDVSVEIQNNGGKDVVSAYWYLSDNQGSPCTTTTDVLDVQVANGAPLGGSIIDWAGTGCAGLATGDRWSGNFTIIYQFSGEDFNHTSTGSIQTRVEI